VNSAVPQSSVLAPRKSTTSSCSKFLVPSGLFMSSCMSPCTDRFSPSSVRSAYLASSVTAIVQLWSPTSYLGEHVALNEYVLYPVELVSFLNAAASMLPSRVRV